MSVQRAQKGECLMHSVCACVCQGFFVKFLGCFFFQVEKQFSEVNAKQDTLSTD